MQTSLARRQRHRRSLGRGRPSGSSTVRRVVLVIPIVVFLGFLAVGLVGVIGVAAAYNYYSQGLPDPRDTLSNLSFDQQTLITDRTGKVKLASLGEFKREIVAFAQIPPEMLDATPASSQPPWTRSADIPAAARRSRSSWSGPGSCRRARSPAAARSGRSARSSSRSA
jgi:hypothetical protein